MQEAEKNLSVGAVLGSARAYMLLKQTQKAKVQLKRVATHPWSLEDADYLQQCQLSFVAPAVRVHAGNAGWLLLADIYINQSKSEQATAVLRTVLQYNAVRRAHYLIYMPSHVSLLFRVQRRLTSCLGISASVSSGTLRLLPTTRWHGACVVSAIQQLVSMYC